ncbi:Os02g0614666, partial [Oryza sativa Japonica Group]
MGVIGRADMVGVIGRADVDMARPSGCRRLVHLVPHLGDGGGAREALPHHGAQPLALALQQRDLLLALRLLPARRVDGLEVVLPLLAPDLQLLLQHPHLVLQRRRLLLRRVQPRPRAGELAVGGRLGLPQLADRRVLGVEGLGEAAVLGGELRGLLGRGVELPLELPRFLLLRGDLAGRLHDDLLPLLPGDEQLLHAGSQSSFHLRHCSLYDSSVLHLKCTNHQLNRIFSSSL